MIGLLIGDLCLFRAFVLIGARKSVPMMSLAPPMAAVMGGVFMNEWLHVLDWVGLVLTVGGVSWVVFERRSPVGRNTGSTSPLGILLGFVASLARASGLVLSKFGMGNYDAFTANEIRILAGIGAFIAVAGVAVLFLC